MENVIEELILTMSREIEAFNQLLKTLHQKQRAIVEGEIERLTKHVHSEDRLVRKTRSLELERQDRTEKLAQLLAMDNPRPRLSEIIEKVEENYAQRLKEQRDLLRSLIERIQHLNQSNQFLLNYSLNFIESSMRMLFAENEKLPIYHRDGKVQTESKRPKLLDRKL